MAVGEKENSQEWVLADLEQQMEDLKALRRRLCLVMASRHIAKGSRRRRIGRDSLPVRQRIAAARPCPSVGCRRTEAP